MRDKRGSHCVRSSWLVQIVLQGILALSNHDQNNADRIHPGTTKSGSYQQSAVLHYVLISTLYEIYEF